MHSITKFMYILTLDARGIELLLAIDNTKDGVNVDKVMLAKEEKSVVDEGKAIPLDMPYKDEDVRVDNSVEVAETTTLLDVILGITDEESLDKTLSVFVADVVVGNIEADAPDDTKTVLDAIESEIVDIAAKVDARSVTDGITVSLEVSIADVISDTDTLIVDDRSVPNAEDVGMRVTDSVAVAVTSDVEAVLELVGTTRTVESLEDTITLSDADSVDKAVALFVVEIMELSVVEAEAVILSVIKVFAVSVPDVLVLPVIEGGRLSVVVEAIMLTVVEATMLFVVEAMLFLVVEAVLLSIDETVMGLTVVETMLLSVVDGAILSVETGVLLSMLDAGLVTNASLLVVVSMKLLDVVASASVVVVVLPKSVTISEVIDAIADVSVLVLVIMSVTLKVDIAEFKVVAATGSGEVSVEDVITGAYNVMH